MSSESSKRAEISLTNTPPSPSATTLAPCAMIASRSAFSVVAMSPAFVQGQSRFELAFERRSIRKSSCKTQKAPRPALVWRRDLFYRSRLRASPAYNSGPAVSKRCALRSGDQVSRIQSANLFDLIAARAPLPDKLALETQDSTALTYGALFARSAQAANALVALGVKPGDRVAVQIEKSTDVIVVTLACLRAGAVLLPLNTAYTLAELEYFLGDAEPALTLCRPDPLESVRALTHQLNLRSVESLGGKGDGTFAAAIAAAPAEFETV